MATLTLFLDLNFHTSCLASSGTGRVLFSFFSSRMDATEEELELLSLYDKGEWKVILEKFGPNPFLPWVWPKEENLKFIGRHAGENSESLVGVGCGSGLLEWLVSSATGLPVLGVELDRGWWNSKYAKRKFVPMIFAEEPKSGPEDFDFQNATLLFCYFNNGPAFLDYVTRFKGTCFISPGEGRGTYTEPKPFSIPSILNESWKLRDHQEIGNSKDFIAVYERR